MHQYLAQQYGTNVSPEDLEKAASAELFAKLAAEAGVDLNQFSDEQVTELYQDVMGSGQAAQPQGPSDAEKRAEEHADFCGRKMAHAYAQELRLISKQASDDGPHTQRGGFAGVDPPSRSAADRGVSLRNRASEAADKVKKYVGEKAYSAAKLPGVRHVLDAAHKHPTATRVTGGIAGAAAIAEAARRIGKHQGSHEKSAGLSVVDGLAIDAALNKIAAAGYDVDDGANRLAVLLTEYDTTTNSKTASATSGDMAVEIRSLELLEGAGYPVTWNS